MFFSLKMTKLIKDDWYKVIIGKAILGRLKQYILDKDLKRLRDGIDDLLKDKGY